MNSPKTLKEAVSCARSAVLEKCGVTFLKGMVTPIAAPITVVFMFFMSAGEREAMYKLLFDQDNKVDNLILEIAKIFEVDVTGHTGVNVTLEAVRKIAFAKQIKAKMSPIWLAENPAFSMIKSTTFSVGYLWMIGEAAISYFEKQTSLT